MRVLHVTPSFYPATRLGGPTWSTLSLCNGIAAKADVELTVLTTNMNGETTKDRLEDDVLRSYAPCNYSVTYAKCWWGRDFAPGLLASLWRAVKAAEVIHVTGVYSFPTVPTLLLASIASKPVLWSPRGALLATNKWKSVKRPRLKLIWEKACRLALKNDTTLVHATSQAELEANFSRLPGLQGIVIPNGVIAPETIAQPSRMAPQQRGKKSELRLIFIGRLDPIKALDNLIASLSLLPRGFANLRVFGSGQCAYERHLRNLVAAAGLDELVEFEGHLEEDRKSQAFAEADVCIIPSHVESFGMVVAEALAHGVPAIISKGVPWSDVQARNCGILTDNSPRGMARAVLEISRRDRRTMGLNGRRWMQKEFDWSTICDRFFEVYCAMIDGKDFTKEQLLRFGNGR
ncbi:MAG: glycosyltransferase [Pseudomonadota bacterium]